MPQALPIRPPSGDPRGEGCDDHECLDDEIPIQPLGETSREGLPASVLECQGPPATKKPRGFAGPIRVNGELIETVTKMLHKYIYSPPQAIRNSVEWVRNPKTKNIFESHAEFKGALDNWETELYNWSYRQFVAFYKVSRSYRWRPGAIYHSVEESVDFVEKWLTNQMTRGGSIKNGCNDTCSYPNTPKGWLQAISNVVNRRINKLNCLHFVGQRNAGKTWFTNMLLDFYISRGDLENWNKYINASFPFMNLPNRRIAIWNEACITGDECQLEQIKILSEGASTTVAVKHKNPAVVCKVPLIITSNRLFYQNYDFFSSRRIIFNCASIPFDGWEKSIHPFAFMKLIKKYDIEVDEIVQVEEVTQEQQYIDSE